MEFEQAIVIARCLGFEYLADIRHQPNLRQAFPPEAFTRKPDGTTNTLMGVYLQFRTDGRLYVGRTVDLIRRTQQHADYGIQVHYLAFTPCGARKLDRLETTILHAAKDLAVPLGNVLEKGYVDPQAEDANATVLETSVDDDPVDDEKAPASNLMEAISKREAPFTETLTASDQLDFLARLLDRPRSFGTLANLFKYAPASDTHHWQAFQLLPQYERVLDEAARFVERFIPVPHDLLGAFVGVSIDNMQRTRKALRITTAGGHPLLVIYGWNRAPGHYRLRIYGSSRGFETKSVDVEKLKKRLAWAQFEWEARTVPAGISETPVDLEKLIKEDPDGVFTTDVPLSGFLGLLLDREWCQWVGVYVLAALNASTATDQPVGNSFAHYQIQRRLAFMPRT